MYGVHLKQWHILMRTTWHPLSLVLYLPIDSVSRFHLTQPCFKKAERSHSRCHSWGPTVSWCPRRTVPLALKPQIAGEGNMISGCPTVCYFVRSFACSGGQIVLEIQWKLNLSQPCLLLTAKPCTRLVRGGSPDISRVSNIQQVFSLILSVKNMLSHEYASVS